MFFLLVSCSLFLVSSQVLAASFIVTPAVIDLKAKARDILTESITLANTASRKLNIYTFVNNIAVEEGRQEFLDPSRADRETSLANWIEISRGVAELLPKEKKQIDFEIDVFLRAKPGMYHAFISFGEGSTRDEAEKNISSAPAVTVNLEVGEDIKEKLQLKKFIPDKVFFSGFPASFIYEIENIGNRPASPAGEIRIYNRRGEEVASIEVNDKHAAIEPQSSLRLASVWSNGPQISSTMLASVLPLDGNFGRYKAILDLEYGATQRGTLQDTIFFWVIPLPELLMFFGFLLALAITGMYLTASIWYKK